VVKRNLGFTYLTALFALAILMGGLALVGEMWETSAAREREAQLLFVGNEYRKAIGLYYNSTPGAAKRYPGALEDLIKDPRLPQTQRYLRRLYADPLGGSEWGLVRADDGGIAGVYSQSDAAPVKVAGFRVRDAMFEGAVKYSDWRFIYAPAGAGTAKK
jgi:type II secretory pathway pseudopilin PulG